MTASINGLYPCPCGETPGKLCITGDHATPKYARVSGDCCGTWEIEYRNQYHRLDGAEAMRLAAEAWNDAPRGTAP